MRMENLLNGTEVKENFKSIDLLSSLRQNLVGSGSYFSFCRHPSVASEC